jgi:hypothetical protein
MITSQVIATTHTTQGFKSSPSIIIYSFGLGSASKSTSILHVDTDRALTTPAGFALSPPPPNLGCLLPTNGVESFEWKGGEVGGSRSHRRGHTYVINHQQQRWRRSQHFRGAPDLKERGVNGIRTLPETLFSATPLTLEQSVTLRAATGRTVRRENIRESLLLFGLPTSAFCLQPMGKTGSQISPRQIAACIARGSQGATLIGLKPE